MSDFFKYFPLINYNGKTVRNITRAIAVLDDLRSDPYAFLPYTIKDGESAEEIAEYYYGSISFLWLVHLSAKVFDPYKQWPMNYEKFNEHLKAKYKDQAESDGQTDVLAWTQNTLTDANIIHYRLIEDNEIVIEPYTYTNDPFIDAEDWEAVRVYDYEDELNQTRASIVLLNNEYKMIADRNLRDFIGG